MAKVQNGVIMTEIEDRRESVVAKPNNLQYLIAVVTMALIGVAGVVTVEVLRADKDNVALDAVIIGFLAPTTLSLLAFMKAQETHLSVNSRLDAFMHQARLASKAEGLMIGRREGWDSANERTDSLAAANAPASGSFAVPAAPILDPLDKIEKNTKEAAETLKQIKDR